jgi:hypothetical protein
MSGQKLEGFKISVISIFSTVLFQDKHQLSLEQATHDQRPNNNNIIILSNI